MKRLAALGVIIVLLFAGALWFFNSSGTVHPRTNPRGAVLAKMGAMTCYLYTENITTVTGNSAERTFVEGGSFNGSYFFHGRKGDLEWWGLIRGKELVERVSRNGTVSHLRVNLTESEIKDLLLYDPIKTGLRALGSASSVKASDSWVASNYTIYVTYRGSGAIMSGTVKVFYGKDYTPERIELKAEISNGREVLQEFSLSAEIISSCRLPEWVKGLED
jgi:hypothetical protein